MSGRSSRPSALVLVAALAGCGSKADPHAGQAKGDPARVQVLAAYMVENVPRPGVVPECKPEEFYGGYPMTHVTLLKLGKKTWQQNQPEYSDWINPAEMDAPSARVLLDDKASPEDKAYAAGDFVNAKFYVVYRVENLDSPIGLGVKDPKISTVGTHITKYTKLSVPVCSTVFHFQSSKDKSDWAIAHSDKPMIDPKVSQVIRDDLTARYLELAPRVTPPAGSAAAPAKQ